MTSRRAVVVEPRIRIALRARTPRALRERFADAFRAAISRAYADGRVDLGQAEDLRRILPAPGRA